MKIIIIAIIALVMGLVIGSVVDLEFDEDDDNEENGSHGHNLPHGHSAAHEMVAVPEGQPVPTVDLIVHDDPKSGWNLQVVIENLNITPESAGLAHVDGEGHAHLYINGDKITRLYGEWFYLSKDWLQKGSHEIKITLSSNDHKDFMYNDAVISDFETIVVS
jgi:hypothetical protein